MTKHNTFSIIRCDDAGYDFVIAGVPLKDRLRRHERVHVDHISALGTVDGARARLLLASEPDLNSGATALFVCGMCGGYDGNPIGARIRRDHDTAFWEDMGFHYDIEQDPILFSSVTSFAFDWIEYQDALLSIETT
jgi:hypothetical protein